MALSIPELNFQKIIVDEIIMDEHWSIIVHNMNS